VLHNFPAQEARRIKIGGAQKAAWRKRAIGALSSDLIDLKMKQFLF
jgi:hypothetical protein